MTQYCTRNYNIDVVRGLALLVIFVDHVEIACRHTLFWHFTLMRWGLSDALEVFVFLFGYTCGISYTRRIEGGFTECQLRATRRAAYLILANFWAFVTVLSFAWMLAPEPDALVFLGIQAAVSQPGVAIVEMATFRYRLFCFDVLPLYAVLLCMMPSQLWLYKKNPCFAFCTSFSVYAIVQVAVALNLKDLSSRWLTYDPLAWQFLFFGGLLVSRTSQSYLLFLRRPRVAAVSLVLFVLLTWAANTFQSPTLQHYWHWAVSRPSAGPMRLMHFVLLAIPIAWVLHRFPYAFDTTYGRPLAACGRHSLVVFIVGLLLTYNIRFCLHDPLHWTQLLACELAGVVLMLCLAMILSTSGQHAGQLEQGNPRVCSSDLHAQ